MKYYEIIASGNFECLNIAEDAFLISKYDLENGIHLNDYEIKETTIIYPSTVRITDWVCVRPYVVSEYLKMLIESVNCRGIQFLPFIAQCENGTERHKLFIINYLPVINEALDIENSLKSSNWPQIKILFKPALKGSCVGDLDIFRLPYTNAVIVSEKLVKLIKLNKLSGMEFVRVINTDEQKEEKMTSKAESESREILSGKGFGDWLDCILKDYNIETSAFCFNIYENTDGKFSVEIVGTDSFNIEDEDWACDEVYASRNFYSEFEFESSDWKAALRRVVKEVKTYLKNGTYAVKLKKAYGIACGFVDGDLKIVYNQNKP